MKLSNKDIVLIHKCFFFYLSHKLLKLTFKTKVYYLLQYFKPILEG